MFRYAKNVRLASFLALTCSLRLSLALSGSYWISPCLSLALYGSLWLPLWLSLPLSGILWPSLAHYCSLISRIHSLIGSQGPCSAFSAAATLTHFLPLFITLKKSYNKANQNPPLPWCWQKSEITPFPSQWSRERIKVSSRQPPIEIPSTKWRTNLFPEASTKWQIVGSSEAAVTLWFICKVQTKSRN